MTEPADSDNLSNTHDPEVDATYLFNTNRSLPYEGQRYIAQNTLDYLNSVSAASQYSPADLVYMRNVWSRVLQKVEKNYGPEAS